MKAAARTTRFTRFYVILPVRAMQIRHSLEFKYFNRKFRLPLNHLPEKSCWLFCNLGKAMQVEHSLCFRLDSADTTSPNVVNDNL